MNTPPPVDRTRRFQSELGLATPLRQASVAQATISPDEIAFLAEGLAYAPRVLRTAVRKITARHHLGPRGAWILSVISHGVTYPLELAAIFGVGRSLITAELTRLTDAGLIESRPNSVDRRKSELSLTSQGQAAAGEVREEFMTIVSRRLAGFRIDEILLAAEVLRALSLGSEDESDLDQV